MITVYWPTCDKIQHKESFPFSNFTAHIYWYWLLMLIAHYRHCPGDHEIWLILYLWLLMGGSKHLDGGFDAIIKYFICCSKLFDKCSQSQRCFKTTILSKLDTPIVMCLASNCHKWKGIPIIPDWNVFHHKAWKSVYPGAHRDHPPLYNLPEITLGGGPHIVTVSGMWGLIVNILIDSSNQRHLKRVQKYSIEQIKSIQS